MEPKKKLEGSLSDETKGKLKEWAEKSGNDYDELESKAIELKNMLIEQKEMPEDAAEQAARYSVYRDIQGAVLSNAIKFEGFIFGAPDKFDANEPKRQRMLRQYRTGTEEIKQQMISEGTVEQEGESIKVMDTNPNSPNYGDELGHFWIRSIVGLARKAEEGGKLKLLKLTMRNEPQVDVDVITGKPVEFMAIEDDITDDEIIAHGSNLTEFEETEVDVLEDVDWLEAYERSVPDRYKADLWELEEWHEAHEDEQFRVVFTEGNVSNVSRQENQIGNYTIILGDEELGVEANPVFVGLDKGQIDQVDFGSGTRLVVCGRTNQLNDGRVNIRAYGFEPRYKLDLDGM